MTLIELCSDVSEVQYRSIIDLLQASVINDKDARIIARLYWSQQVVIRVDNQNSEEIPLRNRIDKCVFIIIDTFQYLLRKTLQISFE